MSKVSIVTSSEEVERVTGLGTIKFDSEGVSKEKYDREDILPLLRVSPSLSIKGEKRSVSVPVQKEEVKKEPTSKNRTYTAKEVEDISKENSSRLLKLVSESLGIDQSVIEELMIATTVAEPHVLVTREDWDSLQPGKKTVQDLDSSREGKQIEISEKEESILEELAKHKIELAKSSIEKLRGALAESKIEESLYKDLKGTAGKTSMIELILSEIEKEIRQ